MARGPDQAIPLVLAQMECPPAERQDLRYSGTPTEHGKPVVLLRRTADRKGSLWGSGYRKAEEANAVR